MKLNYKFLLMTLLTLCMMGAYSCGGGDDIPEPEPEPIPDPDKVILNTQSLTFEATESSSTLTISANKAWTATSNQTWCTLSKESGIGGSETITINVTANPNETERTATITVKAGTDSATATVKQAKKEVEETDKVELDKTSFEVGADNGSVTLKITANKDWTAESSASWCKVSAASGKAGTTELTVTYEANPNESERTATITVKAGTASATTTVKQAKKESQQGGGDSGEEGTNGGNIEDMENKKW